MPLDDETRKWLEGVLAASPAIAGEEPLPAPAGPSGAVTTLPEVIPVRNPNGSFSSERTKGFEIDGRETVVPTLIEGKQLTDKEAVKFAIESGLVFPSFGGPDRIEKAKAFAAERSRTGGATTHGFLGELPTGFAVDEPMDPMVSLGTERFVPPTAEEIAAMSPLMRTIKAGFQLTTAGQFDLGLAEAEGHDVDLAPHLQGLEPIGASIIGIVADPTMYVSFGLGGALGKAAGKKVAAGVARPLARRVAETATRRGVTGAVGLGAHAGVQDVARRRTVDAETLRKTRNAAIVGGVALPLGGVPFAGAALEIGAFGTVGPLLEGRMPTADDYIHAVGVILGLRGINAVVGRALHKLSRGETPTAEEAEAIRAVTPQERAMVAHGAAEKTKSGPSRRVTANTEILDQLRTADKGERDVVQRGKLLKWVQPDGSERPVAKPALRTAEEAVGEKYDFKGKAPLTVREVVPDARTVRATERPVHRRGDVGEGRPGEGRTDIPGRQAEGQGPQPGGEAAPRPQVPEQVAVPPGATPGSTPGAERPPAPPPPPSLPVGEGGRPELAIPATDPGARQLVRQVDELRKAAGIPEVRRDVEVEREAIGRIEADYPGERQNIVDAARQGRQFNDVETRIGQEVIGREGAKAFESRDLGDMETVARLVDSYRDVRTETGRALRQGRDPLGEPVEKRRERTLVESIAESPPKIQKKIRRAKERGDTAELNKVYGQWAKEMDKLVHRLEQMGLDMKDLDQVLKDDVTAQRAVNTVSASKKGMSDKLYEFWRNSILSGAQTMVVNFGTTPVWKAADLLGVRLLESSLGSTLARLNLKPKDMATLGEYRHILTALVAERGKMWANFWRTWNSETPFFEREVGGDLTQTKLEQGTVAIAGKTGRIIRMPQRLLLASDELNKTWLYSTEVVAQAYRQARNEGLRSAELQARMRELLNDPQSMVHERAIADAHKFTFTERDVRGDVFDEANSDMLKFMLKVRRAAPEFTLTRYHIPFITTLGNIFKSGVKMSPLGSVTLVDRLIRAARTGDYTGIPRASLEQLLAWSLFSTIYFLNSETEPWITGTVNFADPAARQEAYRGRQPQSIRLPWGGWVSYSRAEPFATALALMVDTANGIQSGKGLDSAAAPFVSIMRQLNTKTFAAGIGDLMNLMRARDSDALMTWATNFAASWEPNFIRSGIRESRPTFPERRVWGEGPERTTRRMRRLFGKLEWSREEPKVDLWGQDAERMRSPIPNTDIPYRIINPLRTADADVPMGDVIRRHWNAQHLNDERHPLVPNPWYKREGKTVFMSDEEYTAFSRRAGQIADTLVKLNYRGDGGNPTDSDMDLVTDALRKSRSHVKDEMEGKIDTKLPVREAASTIFRKQNASRVLRLTDNFVVDGKDRPERRRAANETIDRFKHLGFTPQDVREILDSHWRDEERSFRTAAYSQRLRRIGERYGVK